MVSRRSALPSLLVGGRAAAAAAAAGERVAPPEVNPHPFPLQTCNTQFIWFLNDLGTIDSNSLYVSQFGPIGLDEVPKQVAQSPRPALAYDHR